MVNHKIQKDFTAAKQHHMDFWNGTGMAMSLTYSDPSVNPFGLNAEEFGKMHRDPRKMVQREIERIEKTLYFSDSLPFLMLDYGTVILSQMMGAPTSYHDGTVWYDPCPKQIDWEFHDDMAHWAYLQQVYQEMLRNKPENAIISAPAYNAGIGYIICRTGR